MIVRYKTAKCDIEVSGDDTKACFDEIAGAIEVFGSQTCGACDSTNTVPVVRDSKGNKYYEMRCVDCGAALGFGQRKSVGALFPRRTKDGSYLPGNGWTKWQPTSSDEAF